MQIQIVKLKNIDVLSDMKQIIASNNPWIDQNNIDIHKKYTVQTTNGSYTNLIINTSNNIHAELVNRNYITLNNGKYKCYEYINNIYNAYIVTNLVIIDEIARTKSYVKIARIIITFQYVIINQ